MAASKRDQHYFFLPLALAKLLNTIVHFDHTWLSLEWIPHWIWFPMLYYSSTSWYHFFLTPKVKVGLAFPIVIFVHIVRIGEFGRVFVM